MISYKSIEENTKKALEKILAMSDEEITKEYLNTDFEFVNHKFIMFSTEPDGRGRVNYINIHHNYYEIYISHYSKLNDDNEFKDKYTLHIGRSSTVLITFNIKNNELLKLYNELLGRLEDIKDNLLIDCFDGLQKLV